MKLKNAREEKKKSENKKKLKNKQLRSNDNDLQPSQWVEEGGQRKWKKRRRSKTQRNQGKRYQNIDHGFEKIEKEGARGKNMHKVFQNLSMERTSLT